jgi:hypothetical protein
MIHYSVSYGRNKSALASHFPVWAKERFNGVVDLMKEYLQTAFGTFYRAERRRDTNGRF